jgi:hypothetical protein
MSEIIDSCEVNPFQNILTSLDSSASEAYKSWSESPEEQRCIFEDWCSQSLSMIINQFDHPVERVTILIEALKNSFAIKEQG